MTNLYRHNKSLRQNRSRNGRLLELFPADKHLIKIAGHTRIKSFVRTKWGDFLGGIDNDGIFVDDANYIISIGNKQFSYRNPQPFRNTESGALLFKLAKNTFDINNITSMKDNLRLPEQYSIEHWLNDKQGIYLYIGKKSGLSFLDITGNKEENIIAFINQTQATATIVPLKDKLKISLAEIRDYFAEGKIGFSENKKGLSLLSCLNKVCQSHIGNAVNQIDIAKWGLSVWQVSGNGDVKKLAYINHCKDRRSFNTSPALAALVETAKNSGQESVILIGHNSVFCESKQELVQWFKPFALDKLEYINFKQPYIGIINLKNNKLTELVGNDYIQTRI